MWEVPEKSCKCNASCKRSSRLWGVICVFNAADWPG